MLRDQAIDLVLSERGEAVLPIADGDTSMAPHLEGGDLLLVRPLRRPPVPGDLLVFRQQDYLVVHRLLGRARTPHGEACLRTRGDGRSALDPPLLAADVRGRVVAVGHAGAWRALDGRAAAFYARLIAWHDLVWAAAAVAGRSVGLGRLAEWLDRGLLHAGAAFVFPLFHRRIAPPSAPGPDAAV